MYWADLFSDGSSSPASVDPRALPSSPIEVARIKRADRDASIAARAERRALMQAPSSIAVGGSLLPETPSPNLKRKRAESESRTMVGAEDFVTTAINAASTSRIGDHVDSPVVHPEPKPKKRSAKAKGLPEVPVSMLDGLSRLRKRKRILNKQAPSDEKQPSRNVTRRRCATIALGKLRDQLAPRRRKA